MSPLDVKCPYCERKPGHPCQDLRGVVKYGMWIEDETRGGWVGPRDIKRPHAERKELVR